MKLRDEITAKIAAINAAAAQHILDIQTKAAADVAILQGYLDTGGAVLNLETDIFKSKVDTLISVLRAKV